jgi:hypothetical protein
MPKQERIMLIIPHLISLMRISFYTLDSGKEALKVRSSVNSNRKNVHYVLCPMVWSLQEVEADLG